MNRRNFIRKVLGAGAALYVPEKTYGFLFPDKCGAWREGCIAMTMRFDHGNGLWIPGSVGTKHEINRLVKAFQKQGPATVWAPVDQRRQMGLTSI